MPPWGSAGGHSAVQPNIFYEARSVLTTDCLVVATGATTAAARQLLPENAVQAERGGAGVFKEVPPPRGAKSENGVAGVVSPPPGLQESVGGPRGRPGAGGGWWGGGAGHA
jgi:hypothetical protein